MSQVLSTPIRQSTGRCVLFGGNFAVLQFLCNPNAFWSVVAYSCSADFPFSWPLVNTLSHSGSRWDTVRRGARRQAQCRICWYATAQLA